MSVRLPLALYGSIAWKHPFGLRQVLTWARAVGWDLIDARGMSLGVPGDPQRNQNAFGYDMLGPDFLRQSARRELTDALRTAELPLLCIYCAWPANQTGPQGEASRQQISKYLQLAADLGAAWVRVINNTLEDADGRLMTDSEAYQRTVAGLTSLMPLARDLNVGLLLENNENTVTANAQQLLDMQRDLGPSCRVGIAFDPVNAYFQELEVDQEATRLAGQVDCLHVKNVKRLPQLDAGNHSSTYLPRGRWAYQWTALDQGDLNWSQLIPRLVEAGFTGPVTYEYVNPFKGMPPEYWEAMQEPEAAAHSAREYLTKIVNPVPG